MTMNTSILAFPRIRHILQGGLGAILLMPGPALAGAEPPSLRLATEWVMKKGDDPLWAGPELDHAAWQPTQVGAAWEETGFPDHDGFAWYRVRFRVPEQWRNHPQVRSPDGILILSLGWIDDVDSSFFNGTPVGRTGRMPPDYETAYDQERTYRIPASLVHWGRTNVLAVRVFDGEGPGGIYQGPVILRPPTRADFVEWGLHPLAPNGIYSAGQPIALSCRVLNQSSDTLSLELESTLLGDVIMNPPVIQRVRQERTLPAGGPVSFPLEFAAPGPGFYRVTCRLHQGDTTLLSRSMMVGVAPEDMATTLTRPPDFDAFWQQRKQDLADVDPAITMTRSELSTDDLAVYLVEMRSYGNVQIRGWYSVPRTPGPHPAILHVPGYTGSMEPRLTVTDRASLALNPRGHGNSKDDLDPADEEYMYLGLDPDHPEHYVYVGAYLDTVRAIDFLVSRPEIDASLIGVTGGSQGGGLTFAAAALDQRVAFCMPDIPWLGDWPGYTVAAPWPIEEFPKLEAADPTMHLSALLRILSYVDTANLADRIRCPVLMSVGLQDDVCPPRTAFATYNRVTSPKSYRVYPDQGHQVPEAHERLKQHWVRQHLP